MPKKQAQGKTDEEAVTVRGLLTKFSKNKECHTPKKKQKP